LLGDLADMEHWTTASDGTDGVLITVNPGGFGR
jgi:uncharacterized protein YbjT (DUF2867 family)